MYKYAVIYEEWPLSSCPIAVRPSILRRVEYCNIVKSKTEQVIKMSISTGLSFETSTQERIVFEGGLRKSSQNKIIEEHIENEKKPKTEHADISKLAQRQYSSLQESLRAQREEAEQLQRERDAMKYAPPRGLDEEDVQFLDDQERATQEERRRRLQQELEDKKAFEDAQLRAKQSRQRVVKGSLLSKPIGNVSNGNPLVNIVKKSHFQTSTDDNNSDGSTSAKSSNVATPNGNTAGTKRPLAVAEEADQPRPRFSNASGDSKKKVPKVDAKVLPPPKLAAQHVSLLNPHALPDDQAIKGTGKISSLFSAYSDSEESD